MCMSILCAIGQTYSYQYPTITTTGSPSYPRNSVSGTGSFANTTVVPNFTWTVSSSSGNKIHSFSTTASSTEMTLTNPWETKYGQVNSSTRGFNVRHTGNGSSSGQPLGIPIVTTITFPVPAKAYGWGFVVLDMDVDQADISATKPNGTAFSKAEINAWFKGVGNADNASDGSPCWDAANGTVVGASHVASPCTRKTWLTSLDDGDGSYAWFEPNALVKTLTITYYNLQSSASPSYRFYLAASRAVTATGNVYNDVNGTTGGFNGSLIGSAGSDQLYAYLTNNSGTIMDSAVVRSNGSFSFLPQYASSGTTPYKVIVSTTSANIASALPAVTLPDGWAATGENIGTAYASGNNDGDGAANQSLSMNAGASDISNVNFGMQRLPETAIRAVMAGINPGGTTNLTIDPSWFITSNAVGDPHTSDYDGGSVSSVRITGFPTNATSITINGTTYGSCSGCTAFPAAGVRVPYSPATGTTQVIRVDPMDLLEVLIPFAAIDNAGAEDRSAGSITLAFAALLPVDWVYFDVQQQANHISLQWATAQEQNNKGFYIERSADGQSWSSIGWVNTKAHNGNSDVKLNYSFTDNNPINGKNFYRLQQTDLNGRYEYGDVRTLKIENTVQVKAFPNPVIHSLTLSGLNKGETIYLYNITGQQLQQVTVSSPTQVINMSHLSPAMYSIVVADARGRMISNHKIIKQAAR